MFRHALAALVLSLALGSGFVASVRAGNAATVELDAPLGEIEVGTTVTIGFTMLQHGIRPVENGTPALEAIHRASGTVVTADGRPDGDVGHYVVDVVFPESGQWVWTITPHPFPTTVSFPTITVVAPGRLNESAAGQRIEAAIVPACGGTGAAIFDLADLAVLGASLSGDEDDSDPILHSESILPISLSDLLASRPAISAASGVGATLACGQILGQPRDGEVIVGLFEAEASGYAGIARIREADGESALSVYLVPGLASGAAAGPDVSVVPSATTVLIEGSAFGPATVQVKAGTAVTWINRDSVKHEVAFEDVGLDDSGLFDPGGSFTQIFTVPGTYAYVCGPHPGMVGTVTVI